MDFTLVPCGAAMSSKALPHGNLNGSRCMATGEYQEKKTVVSNSKCLFQTLFPLTPRITTFISCYRTPGPQKGFRRVSEFLKGSLKGSLKGFRRVLEGFQKGFRRVLS